jgi:hypothetical protein
MKTRCEECEHRAEVSKTRNLSSYIGWECHKRAPVLIVDSDGRRVSGWPSVSKNDWCGEGWPLPKIAPEAVQSSGDSEAR